MHKAFALPALLAAAATAVACQEREEPPRRPVEQSSSAASPAAPPPTDAPPGGTAPAAALSTTARQLPPGVTAEMVSQGQRLFGTVCVACHGGAGTGGPLGPALTDRSWIHITGEYAEIVEITRTGVPRPREYPAPMPPMGGGRFDDDQLRAIAAYVYSISHGG